MTVSTQEVWVLLLPSGLFICFSITYHLSNLFLNLTCKAEIKGLREVLKRLKLINFTHPSEFLGYNLHCPVLS